MNYSDEEEGQFTQMVKAKDILKNVDLNDVPVKSRDQYLSMQTPPHGEKPAARVEAEDKLMEMRDKHVRLPGRYEGAPVGGQGQSLFDSVKERGVQNPIHVGFGNGQAELWNGHNRLAAQMAVDPEAEMPVKFMPFNRG